ncbi:MAG: hypothetical protein ISR58_18310 [Anaerolineales bacterium]|nr:hypothetical protein [Chloroflexota bacterium]MBL6983133.1 hypothetical protein [Anaerolineales bacterium]
MNPEDSAPAYIPGRASKINQPMGRYLPPIPEGVAAAWLEKLNLREGWVLDPFGASPRLVEEIARSGFRVLVSANNPVIAFILKMIADPPKSDELKSALTAIGSAKFRDTRIEPYIRSQYQTRCQGCEADIQAEAFLWDHDGQVPFGRIYTCPHCKDSGEFPATEADKTLASNFTQDALPRARALERVAPLNDPVRIYAEEALDVYPNRAVSVLGILINKLDGLRVSEKQKDHLSALLLTAFDRANTLWPHPTARERPRQLTIPPQYRENNIWLALENAITLWTSDLPDLPLTIWPELPPDRGGICLFEGRIKELIENLGHIPIRAVLTAYPRPNQAFWTLSALWTGWLWGSEVAEEFKSVLRRQRYSWRWHSVALHSALKDINKSIPSKTPFFGLIGETEPGFITAVISASHFAGLDLQGVSLREKEEQAQISYSFGETTSIKKEGVKPKDAIKLGAQNFLQARAQPADYMAVLAAGLSAYAQEVDPIGTPTEKYYDLQNDIEEAISYRGGLLHLEAGQSLESGSWWLQEYESTILPLADRVEIALVNYLLRFPGSTFDAIDSFLCGASPSLLTPDTDLIRVCLESYTEEQPQGSGFWHLRQGDAPANRRQDLAEIKVLLPELGANLGLTTEQVTDDPLAFQWYGQNNVPFATLYLTASAVIGKIINAKLQPQGKALIMLPGGRANIVAYKLNNNPILREEVSANWEFIKFRHLHYLVGNPMLTIDNLDEQIALDPLTYSEPQIRLL